MNLNRPAFITISLISISLFMSSCHFGFPDCEGDGNMNYLIRKISSEEKKDKELIKITKVVETGLDDAGLGSNSFTCECRATYSIGGRTGSISYEVTRNGFFYSRDNFSTRVKSGLSRSDRYIPKKVAREGEVDSIVSINQVYKLQRNKYAKEILNFNSSRPEVGKEYKFLLDGEYSDLKLVSFNQLNDRKEEYDYSKVGLDWKFALLFEFRNEDKIQFYITQSDYWPGKKINLDDTSYVRAARHKFKVIEKFSVENTKDLADTAKLLRCVKTTINKEDLYLILFNNQEPTDIHDLNNVIDSWRIVLMDSVGSAFRYHAFDDDVRPGPFECL